MHSSRMRTTRSSSRLVGPLGVDLETPPRLDPSTYPLVVSLEIPLGQTPQFPPWMWAWRPAARHVGIPPAMHAGIPPCEQNHSHV